jgi:ABC-type glycerol-3-phosphate transport system substrate-binding protein
MHRSAPFLLLLAALLLGGCLAVAAGAAGGAAASGGNDIEYYIKTEGPPQEIAQAMREERIVEEMNRAEVRLVMDQKNWILRGARSQNIF